MAEQGLKVSMDYLKKQIGVVNEGGFAHGGHTFADPVKGIDVGYGHSLANPTDKIIGRHISPGDTITLAEGDKLLEHDIQKSINSLNSHFPWFKDVDGSIQYAMIDMHYSMGLGTAPKDGKPGTGLLGFQNTLAAFKTNDPKKAAEALSNNPRLRSQQKGRVDRNVSIVGKGYVPESLTQLASISGSSNETTTVSASTSGSSVTTSTGGQLSALTNMDMETVEQRFARLFGIQKPSYVTKV